MILEPLALVRFDDGLSQLLSCLFIYFSEFSTSSVIMAQKHVMPEFLRISG